VELVLEEEDDEDEKDEEEDDSSSTSEPTEGFKGARGEGNNDEVSGEEEEEEEAADDDEEDDVDSVGGNGCPEFEKTETTSELEPARVSETSRPEPVSAPPQTQEEDEGEEHLHSLRFFSGLSFSVGEESITLTERFEAFESSCC
jgi:hypothetical protein